jgi:hypothetical protein
MRTEMRRGALWVTIATLAVATGAPAVTLTRGPYLQTPTPASMIVRWRTDFPTSSRVAIGPAPGSLATNFDDPTPVTEHVVSVTGLTPDTLYYYSVGSAAGAFVGDDADHFFRSAPPTGPARPFRLWTIGDAGFTGPDLDSVRDAFKAYNGGTSATDLFLLLGDNAYLTGTDAQYQAAVYDVHAEMLRTTPVYSTFGNHERFSSQDLTETGPYFQMFSFPTGGEAGGVASGTESYYSFDFANVHFVVLDSEDFAPTSTSNPMLTWLQADLAATTADWVIALWHRPPYSRGLFHDSDVEAKEINMRQYVLPMLESVGVDVVLCGHSHSYERSYFLDGHYGLSTTFSSAFQKDAGDGDPAGDGSYRKTDVGPIPNSGAVYVVNGSGSEFRNATLDHPAHHIGLLEVGSMVIDVAGNTLTARFLSGVGAIDDAFQIVKGSTCAPTPATGCNTAVRGRMIVRENPNPARSRWSWKWKGGSLDAADVGDPTASADYAVCVYDATGFLVGGQVFGGAPEWRPNNRGFEYKDKLLSRHGFQKIKIRTGSPSLGAYVQAKAKGTGIGNPTLPVTTPIVAQLVNLDTGKCWASQFTSTRINLNNRVIAVIP